VNCPRDLELLQATVPALAPLRRRAHRTIVSAGRRPTGSIRAALHPSKAAVIGLNGGSRPELASRGYASIRSSPSAVLPKGTPVNSLAQSREGVWQHGLQRARRLRAIWKPPTFSRLVHRCSPMKAGPTGKHCGGLRHRDGIELWNPPFRPRDSRISRRLRSSAGYQILIACILGLA